jgi:methionyl-tRNA formyltransferase
LKILNGSVRTPYSVSVPYGTVAHHDGRIAIATGEGWFYPARVQLEGKSAVSIDDFVRGYASFVGAVVG